MRPGRPFTNRGLYAGSHWRTSRQWHTKIAGRRVLMVSIAIVAASNACAQDPGNATTRVPVLFSGGHETDPRDRGRPVVLVAGALGVPANVFRDAFRKVRPAPAGTEPDPEQVRRNKAALMGALGRYGVTNRRLDTVSNYYRYNRSRGQMWPTKPATAYAEVANGKITGFVVTNGGSGYGSAPTVNVPKFGEVTASVTLSFSEQFDKNGAVASITLSSANND